MLVARLSMISFFFSFSSAPAVFIYDRSGDGPCCGIASRVATCVGLAASLWMLFFFYNYLRDYDD